MIKQRPGVDQRPPHIERAHVLIGAHPGQQPSRLVGQRLRRPRRQHPRHRHRVVAMGRANRFHCRCLFQNHMCVGAADPERRHTGPPRPARHVPRPRLGQQRHRPRRPIHMRRRHIHVQRLGQHAVAHRLHHLDHPGDPRSRRRMTDVRFDRPQPQRPIGRPLSIRRQNRLRLNGIPQRGARPVPLDHIHVGDT